MVMLSDIPSQRTTPRAGSMPAAGSEMGARIAAFDWSTTSLGPQEKWPHSLRATLGIMLSSRYPMFICWGAIS